MEKQNDLQKFVPVYQLNGINKVWDTLLAKGMKKNFPKGSHIDGYKDMFGYLYRGKIRLSAITSQGRERIVLYMENGCICTEVNLFHNYHNMYSAEFMAMTPCTIYFFPKEMLSDVEFTRQYPELITNLVQSLSCKAGAFFSQLSEKTELNFTSQFCRFLYRQYLEANNTIFKFGFSQVELALMFNLHRNTICRVLSVLRDEGIIGKCTKNCLEILDLERLEELAQV